MFCPECGHRNPEDNRFCGMCGERLPERNRRPAGNRPAPPATPQPEEKAQDLHREKWVEAPAGTANPVYSMPARREREERRVETWRNEPPRRVTEPTTSSTSFLGLGNTEYEKPEREISWRFWALMLLILGVAALFGMQWRASKLRAQQQQQEQQKPAATQSAPSDSGDNQGNTPPKDSSALPSPTPEQSQPNQAQPPVKEKDIPAPKGADAKSKADEKTGGDTTNTTEDDNPPKQQAETRAETAPRDVSDAPVQQADHLIQGGACNDAVRVLKDANGNPRAMTKLAAMYLTGTCVGPDRVMAYTWFSHAFSADPHNLRLESTRRMVWSQMTDEERARVESGAAAR